MKQCALKSLLRLMAMNILLNKLPETVKIDGKEIPINWDFRTSIKFQDVILDKKLTEDEKLIKGLELYYPTREEDIYNIEEAFEEMLWFYSAGEVDPGDEEEGGIMPKGSGKQAFSYKYDAPYIYAAFLDQYGIDLQEVDMHWWKFKALFDSFRDDLVISQIIKYRTVSTSGMDKETASFYRKMKKIYALPKEISREEKKELDELNKALAEGKDLSELLKD